MRILIEGSKGEGKTVLALDLVAMLAQAGVKRITLTDDGQDKDLSGILKDWKGAAIRHPAERVRIVTRTR